MLSLFEAYIAYLAPALTHMSKQPSRLSHRRETSRSSLVMVAKQPQATNGVGNQGWSGQK